MDFGDMWSHKGAVRTTRASHRLDLSCSLNGLKELQGWRGKGLDESRHSHVLVEHVSQFVRNRSAMLECLPWRVLVGFRAAVWKHGRDSKAQDLRSAFRCRLSAFGRFQASSCCLGVVGGSLFTLSTVRCELVGLANRQMGCAWMKLQAPF